MSVETYSRDSKTDRESLLSRKTYTDVSSNARSQHNRRRLSALGRSIAAQSTADREAAAATADREAEAASRTNQSPQMSEVMVLFESLSEVGAMGLVNAVEGLASRVTKCLRLFHLWDTNNDGILDINEVSAGLKLACEKLERSLVPIELVQESYLQGALASRTLRGLDVGGSVEEQLECCRACEEGWWYVRRAGSLYVYGTTYPPHELTPSPPLGTPLFLSYDSVTISDACTIFEHLKLTVEAGVPADGVLDAGSARFLSAAVAAFELGSAGTTHLVEDVTIGFVSLFTQRRGRAAAVCSTLPLYPGVLTLLRYSCGTNGIPTPHHPTPHLFSVCSRSCALHSFIHSDDDLSISDGKFCEKCARKTFSKSNLQNASIFGVLFVIVVLWMGTGTVFYKLYLGWSWEMSFYYAVQAGFCVGFGGTHITRNLSTCTVAFS